VPSDALPLGSAAVFEMLCYYLITLAAVQLTGRLVRKKAGAGSPPDRAMKAPRFLALLIMSASGVAVIALVMNGKMTATLQTYIGVPYFAVMVYTMTTYFRQMKRLRR
jgi:hypothetical protein